MAKSAQAVSREVNISEATLHRWKQQYGAMEIDELKELKALRDENARLKRIVADQVLNIQVLKEGELQKNGKLAAKRHAAQGVVAAGMCSQRRGVPLSWAGTLQLGLRGAAAEAEDGADQGGDRRAGGAPSAIWLPPRA